MPAPSISPGYADASSIHGQGQCISYACPPVPHSAADLDYLWPYRTPLMPAAALTYPPGEYVPMVGALGNTPRLYAPVPGIYSQPAAHQMHRVPVSPLPPPSAFDPMQLTAPSYHTLPMQALHDAPPLPVNSASRNHRDSAKAEHGRGYGYRATTAAALMPAQPPPNTMYHPRAPPQSHDPPAFLPPQAPYVVQHPMPPKQAHANPFIEHDSPETYSHPQSVPADYTLPVLWTPESRGLPVQTPGSVEMPTVQANPGAIVGNSENRDGVGDGSFGIPQPPRDRADSKLGHDSEPIEPQQVPQLNISVKLDAAGPGTPHLREKANLQEAQGEHEDKSQRHDTVYHRPRQETRPSAEVQLRPEPKPRYQHPLVINGSGTGVGSNLDPT